MEAASHPKVYCFMPARNEAKTLPNCLEALKNQTVKIFKICVINDGSTDDTREIAESYGCQVVNLPYHPDSYTAQVETCWKIAEVLNHAFPPPVECNYLMQHSPDAILPPNYIEELTARMEENPRLVIASGHVKGERTVKSHVRGVGRLYKSWFWNKYVKKFPLKTLTYETYPLLKAQSLGLEVQSFPDLLIAVQRQTKTRLYLEKFGFQMREMGYFPPYAIGLCLKTLVQNGRTGIKMLVSYLQSPFRTAVESDVKNWVRRRQALKILRFSPWE